MKKCSKCQQIKSLKDFQKNKAMKDGFVSHCKSCDKIKRQLLRERNPEYVQRGRDYWKEYYQKHKKKIAKKKKQYNAQYYQNRHDKYYSNHAMYLLRSIKSRAKMLNIPFNLETDDITIPNKCPVLNIDIVVNSTDRELHPSVDRLIPALGYVKGNVKVISMKANRLKSNATCDELKQLVRYVEENIKLNANLLLECYHLSNV